MGYVSFVVRISMSNWNKGGYDEKAEKNTFFFDGGLADCPVRSRFHLPVSAAMPACSETVVPYGFFYIGNADNGKYMQMDNNDGPNYNTIGAFMELWDYDGRDMQRWLILPRNGGYYQIANVQSGLSLAVQEITRLLFI